jgi:2,3-bisphosphoglycerate-dependent phosphoglycerate mutase
MVGLKTGFYWYEIGNWKFLYSFFSTISFRLENKVWGKKYPIIMNEFYRGKLGIDSLKLALAEIANIQVQLSQFKPQDVVWNIDKLSEQPPWGNEISQEITDLSNYFVTCNGEDLIEVIREAMEKAVEINEELLIIEL